MTPIDEYFEEDIGNSVLPIQVEESATPLPLDTIQPWHRPRKQYIRELQWRRFSERLIDSLLAANAPSIRNGKINYLTLPGIDHFDVEILGESIRAKGLKFESTGFLSEAEKDPVKARSQFREETLVKRGLIEDTSVTFPYRFEEISSLNSQAYREIKSRAPFHIVNIDACGSIALPSAQHSSRLIDALFRLIEIQIGCIRDPWILFLTTDVRNNNLSDSVKDALDDAIRQNALDSEDFKKGAIICLGETGDDLESALRNSSNDQANFVAKFSLGISKWLLHNANAENWTVKFRSFYSYSTRPEGMDDVSMPCLAFEFHPKRIQMTDPFGAVSNAGNNSTDATNYSMQALEKARSMENLDQLLTENQALRTEFAQKQRLLLEKAGYQRGALEQFDAAFLG